MAKKASRQPKDIAAILADPTLVQTALTRAVRRALVEHCRAGLPAVEWRDGKVVFVPPAELRRRIRAMDREMATRPAAKPVRNR